MNQDFSDFIDKFVVLYLNDNLVYCENEAQYKVHVHTVLSRLRGIYLFAKPEKCALDLQQLDFWRYHISTKGSR